MAFAPKPNVLAAAVTSVRKTNSRRSIPVISSTPSAISSVSIWICSSSSNSSRILMVALGLVLGWQEAYDLRLGKDSGLIVGAQAVLTRGRPASRRRVQETGTLISQITRITRCNGDTTFRENGHRRTLGAVPNHFWVFVAVGPGENLVVTRRTRMSFAVSRWRVVPKLGSMREQVSAASGCSA